MHMWDNKITTPKISWIIKQTLCPFGVPPSARLQWNTALQRPVTGQKQSADWWNLLQISHSWVLSWIIHRIAMIPMKMSRKRCVSMVNLFLSVLSVIQTPVRRKEAAVCILPISMWKSPHWWSPLLAKPKWSLSLQNKLFFFHVEQRLLKTATMYDWQSPLIHIWELPHLLAIYLWFSIHCIYGSISIKIFHISKTQHISQFLELALRVSGRCLQAYPVTAGTFRAPETVYWRGCVTASIVWLTLTATNMCLPKTFQGMKVPVTTAFGPPQNSDTVFFCSWSRLNSFSHKFIAEDNFFCKFCNR